MDINPLLSRSLARSKLPEWERSYQSREDSIFELVENQERGKHLVAKRAIDKGEVILIEDLLISMPITSLHQSLRDCNNYELAKQRQQAIKDKYGEDVVSAQKRVLLSEDEKRDLDSPQKMNEEAYILSCPMIDEIWKLEDVHRNAEVGDTVMIDVLQSEAGKMLNGTVGKVIREDPKQHGRLGIEFPSRKGSIEMRSIKKSNLKTLSGIAQTNGFMDEDQNVHLGALICRINHACMDASNVYVHSYTENQRAYVEANKAIMAGQELLCDYEFANFDLERRREALKERYKFWCQCSMHSENPPAGELQSAYELMAMMAAGASFEDMARHTMHYIS